jgi:hypothetical protein
VSKTSKKPVDKTYANNYPPSIELTRLYEKTSQRGTKYFVGRLGLAKIVLLAGDDAADGTPCWRFLVQEPTPKQVDEKPAPSQSQRRAAYPGPRPAGDGGKGAQVPDDLLEDLWRRDEP